MNFRIMKVCAWSGLAAIVLVGGGFVLAGFIPPPRPSDSAEQTALLYRDHANRIRFGMILVMFGSTLFMPYASIIAIQMRRIEGRYPVLALTQFGVGTLFVLEFCYLAFFWITGTFRIDRPDALIQTLNDMGWIPFIGFSSTLVLQSAAFGIVILCDTGQRYFPRWLGYYNLWVALIVTPGTFNMFFHTGPLAWNGLIAFWIPVPVFATWLIINPIFLARSIDRGAAEDAAAIPVSGELASLHSEAEFEELRDQVALMSSRLDKLAI